MQEATPNPLKLRPLSERLPFLQVGGASHHTPVGGTRLLSQAPPPGCHSCPPWLLCTLYPVLCVLWVGRASDGLGWTRPLSANPAPGAVTHILSLLFIHPCFWVATPHFPAPG